MTLAEKIVNGYISNYLDIEDVKLAIKELKEVLNTKEYEIIMGDLALQHLLEEINKIMGEELCK